LSNNKLPIKNEKDRWKTQASEKIMSLSFDELIAIIIRYNQKE